MQDWVGRTVLFARVSSMHWVTWSPGPRSERSTSVMLRELGLWGTVVSVSRDHVALCLQSEGQTLWLPLQSVVFRECATWPRVPFV
jgi:hypothetical protein